VSYGLHFQEKRRFEFVGNYLDTINALDPAFAKPYRLADTLITLQPKAPRKADYFKAREILERGMRALPLDAELWVTAGQYLAYLAPPYLGDENLANAWRLSGARVLARACELGGRNDNLMYHCITAAQLFSDEGQTEAELRFLEKFLALNTDPELRNIALGRLKAKGEEARALKNQARVERFMHAWQGDLPFVSLDTELLLGPPFKPLACAGLTHSERAECATTWRRWTELSEPNR
jgi:hypothetical protein